MSGAMRQLKRNARAQQQAAAQLTVNAVLWQIIRQNTELDDPDAEAVLTVPKSELEDVPALFDLQVVYGEENIQIKARVREEHGGLVLPKKEIIVG